MQSNMWVQGRCGEVASGFCNDLNEVRKCGEKNKAKGQNISTRTVSLNAKWLYSPEYFNKSCELKARDYCGSGVTLQTATLN